MFTWVVNDIIIESLEGEHVGISIGISRVVLQRHDTGEV